MATKLTVGSSGGVIGRCDAKCHEARAPGCDCICGGRNHGVGERQAEANTARYGAEWIGRAGGQGQLAMALEEYADQVIGGSGA